MNYQAYRKVDIETASQGKLIVMLFNGAIQRAEEAKRMIEKGRIDGVHNNLVRAQEIIAELRNALNMQMGGDIAQNLDRLYEYFQHLLIKANIRKNTEPIDECIGFMVSLRNTWQELFATLAKDQPVKTPVAINQHGAGIINVQG